ncbi:MAG: M48 family metallopeptidase [Saprospiraceae bacterium]
MTIRKIVFYLLTLIAFTFWNCNAVNKLNFFSVEDDINLGKQVSQEIESNSSQYPLLPEAGNEQAYRYIRGLKDKILRTGKVKYQNEFAWQVKIIKDDKTLNAFCTPGGYIYVYTGLIKYLDSEDQLAGVMGHEIAHAALRHSTRQMTKLYGAQILLSIATGKADPGMISQIALGLASLKFSRSHETEADNNSVAYLCPTSYNAAGAAGFFEKLQSGNSGGARQPQFLSTHPDPGNRVENINTQAQQMKCGGRSTNASEYSRIKQIL